MQKHVNLVDLVKSFPTNISLQNLASIQKRTSPLKFAHLAEKSEEGSISNLSTKVCTTDIPLTDGHCPRPTIYGWNPYAPAEAATRRLANGTYTQVHYDYIVEGLHAELATSLQAAVGLLGTDQTVVTSFASTLVALPNMKATGFSLVVESGRQAERSC